MNCRGERHITLDFSKAPPGSTVRLEIPNEVFEHDEPVTITPGAPKMTYTEAETLLQELQTAAGGGDIWGAIEALEAATREKIARELEMERDTRFLRVYMDWKQQTAYRVKVLPLESEWDAAIAVVRRGKR